MQIVYNNNNGFKSSFWIAIVSLNIFGLVLILLHIPLSVNDLQEIPNKSLAEKVEITVNTNVWAQLDLWKSLSPLLKPHAR